MDSSKFWWCLAIRGGKVILGMVLWCSGILLIALNSIMGNWGTYMASNILMSLVIIGQFMIWLFWMDYLKVCVDGHPKIFCNNLAPSSTLISCL